MAGIRVIKVVGGYQVRSVYGKGSYTSRGVYSSKAAANAEAKRLRAGTKRLSSNPKKAGISLPRNKWIPGKVKVDSRGVVKFKTK